MRADRSVSGRRARLLASLLSLFMAGRIGAETLPGKGQVDSRIRTALYSADEVYRLYGFVGYDIELIFEPGEHFTGKGGGDLEAVNIEAYENQVHIKPRAVLVATNLVIYTDRRAYRFDYSAAARRPSRFIDEVMYAVRFTYPQSSASTSQANAGQRIEDELTRAKANRARNADYWFCGHRAVKPVAVSDDGVHTRITFGARAEIPALFVRNADGSESLLNFSMDDGDVVIHRVALRFIVRRGKLTGCIVNKGFLGAGERLESGTVSPNVERERKELRP
jgi:type IV secretion system protein VirB9